MAIIKLDGDFLAPAHFGYKEMTDEEFLSLDLSQDYDLTPLMDSSFNYHDYSFSKGNINYILY